MTQSELRFRKLNQAQHAGPWEGQSRKPRGRGGGQGGQQWAGRGSPQMPSSPKDTRAGKPTQTPSPPLMLHPPPPHGPLFSQRCPLPPLSPASHTLCVCSSSGTPREGPAGGTGGSGGPGGSLGSRGRRRKLYSAVPGRSFMAVKSYQAQAEGEISLSKGEKIKGNRAGPGQAGERGSGRGADRSRTRQSRTNSALGPRLSSGLWGPQRAPGRPSAPEEHETPIGRRC